MLSPMGPSRPGGVRHPRSTDRFPFGHWSRILTLMRQVLRRGACPRPEHNPAAEHRLPHDLAAPLARLRRMPCCCLQGSAPEVPRSRQGRPIPQGLASPARHRRRAMTEPRRFQHSRLYPRPPLGIGGSPRSEAGYSHPGGPESPPDRCTLIGRSAEADCIAALRRRKAAPLRSRSGSR